jgi:hypothetical protein
MARVSEKTKKTKSVKMDKKRRVMRGGNTNLPPPSSENPYANGTEAAKKINAQLALPSSENPPKNNIRPISNKNSNSPSTQDLLYRLALLLKTLVGKEKEGLLVEKYKKIGYVKTNQSLNTLLKNGLPPSRLERLGQAATSASKAMSSTYAKASEAGKSASNVAKAYGEGIRKGLRSLSPSKKSLSNNPSIVVSSPLHQNGGSKSKPKSRKKHATTKKPKRKV